MREKACLFRYAAISMAFIAWLVATPYGLAEGGREFSGFYEISDVTDLGETVSMTLTLQIFNHRNTGVYDVTLTVLTSSEPDADFVTLISPFIGSMESDRLSGHLTLQSEDFERWEQGIPPAPRIEFSDAEGNRKTNMVDFGPSHLSEEG